MSCAKDFAPLYFGESQPSVAGFVKIKLLRTIELIWNNNLSDFWRNMDANEIFINIAQNEFELKIWHYMDFSKFIYLLENESLYFRRIDKLDDKFEGHYSYNDLQKEIELYESFGQDQSKAEYFAEKHMDTIKERKYCTWINCWHINEEESYAMWKIYSGNNKGVAIQSTIDRLYKSKNEDNIDSFYLGKVVYGNHFKDNTPEQLFGTVLFKNNPYIYENELRAIIKRNKFVLNGENMIYHNIHEIREYNKNNKFPIKILDEPDYFPDGIDVKVNLNLLIDKIFVSPDETLFLNDLVKAVCIKYNLNEKEVIQSPVAPEY